MKISNISKGITLLEMLIATALLALIGGMTTKFMVGMFRNNSMLEARNLLKTKDHQGINMIGSSINSSKMFIAHSVTGFDLGEKYFDMIDLPISYKRGEDTFTPLSSSSRKLPTKSGTLKFSVNSPSFNSDYVGNSLFFVSLKDEVDYTFNHDVEDDVTNITSTETDTRTISLYQFLYYYLARHNRSGNIELIEMSTPYYADYSQLKNISSLDGPTESQIASFLSSAKPKFRKDISIVGAWNHGHKSNCGNSGDNSYIYEFSGGLSGNCSYKLPVLKQRNPMLLSGLSSFVTYGVSKNRVKSSNSSSTDNIIFNNSRPLNQKVPIYGTPNYNNDGFPHGFEVMIGGPSGSRKVLVRLVRIAKNGNREIYNETVSTFQGKDS